MRLVRGKKKHALALCGLLLLSPLIAIGISNIFLLSPKGRSLVAAKIAQRIPFETSVAGSTWSPWNGFTVHGIRVEQPEELRVLIARPLLTVQSVTIHPDWMALAGKKLLPKGVDIVKPEAHFAIELLSRIPHADVPAAAAEVPNIAAVPAAPVPGGSPVQSSPGQPNGDTIASSAAVPAPRDAPEILTPNVWINVEGGRVDVVSMMKRSMLFQAAGIDGSVPVSGKKAKSMIRVSRITAFGQEALRAVELPLVWGAPMLGGEITGWEMFGLGVNLGGHVALVPGLPFRIDAVVPEQTDREIRIGGTLLARLGHVASHGRMQGFLQSPLSWQGQCIAKTSSVDVDMGERRSRFDGGRALLLFQNGALRCLDARLFSEEATIIGNGMILSDGRMAGITRIIAAPETLVAISKLTQPAAAPTRFTPLRTPQRAALDLQVFGRPGKLLYMPNPGAAPTLLR